MKIGQYIAEKGSSLSFEFFPPRDDVSENQLVAGIIKLEALNPTFVSVTYGAGGSTLKNTRHVIRHILQETPLVPMPHLTCVDQNKSELKAILEDYRNLGIENVLALRGDPPQGSERFTPPEDGFCYARDLVQLTASLNSFSIGVAVYPEGHCESPNLEMDMTYTKQKIEAGADFAITQMFFDNRYYYDFMERAVKAGINVPIIPGVMPIIDIDRVVKFGQRCGATVPARVIRRFAKVSSTNGDMVKVGIEIATEQCADLLDHGVQCFHFYTLNQTHAACEIVDNLRLHSACIQRGKG
jgi:methylenetetrahydrofolate reductase (NADPH)